MQCSTCRYELPPGVTFCPNCGAPVQAGSSPNQGIPPTVMASPPTPPLPASPYGVPTSYGEAPPPPPANLYGMPPQTPYGAPQQAPYGAPPPQQTPYGAPQQAPYGAPPPQQYVQVQPPPKKNNGCIIAVVIVLVVIVLIVGGVVAAGAFLFNKGAQAVATVGTGIDATATSIEATANSAEATANSGLTPTTGGIPDPSQIDPTAQANITGSKTSNGMDSNFQPTHPTITFSTGQEVDITFTLAGNAGYATAKIYRNGQFVAQPDTPLTVTSGDSNGAFTYTASDAGAYVAGLYWCTQSDCSDAALAQVVAFTVS